MNPGAVQSRSWLAIRWRQFRNAPRPIVRAVGASLVVASLAALLLLAYDVAISRGARLPGGDLRTAAFLAYVVVVLGAGALLTYLWVPLPSGSGSRRRRSAWSGILGLLASLPLAYLGLVVAFQVLRPLLG
jgi:hypothetical protein